ncbi:hypothetical protein B0H11DRAFT_2217379 [Mycena galericulata]|nr:hypothetical protein B0H11DRAFT_2217379 [Mycena galericulata]
MQPRALELYDILGILPFIKNEGWFPPSIARYEPGELKPRSTSKLAEWVEPTQMCRTIALRSAISTSKVVIFALTGIPEHLAAMMLAREEFLEEFYALTKSAKLNQLLRNLPRAGSFFRILRC